MCQQAENLSKDRSCKQPLKKEYKQYIADAVKDDKTNCQSHTLVVHLSYYYCKLCSINVPSHSDKISNLEPQVLKKVLKHRKYLVRRIRNFPRHDT